MSYPTWGYVSGFVMMVNYVGEALSLKTRKLIMMAFTSNGIGVVFL